MVFSIIGPDKLKIDDPVGAISVHGVCGFFDLMVVPLSNADATFGAQLLGAAVIFAFVFGASLVVWACLKRRWGSASLKKKRWKGWTCTIVVSVLTQSLLLLSEISFYQLN